MSWVISLFSRKHICLVSLWLCIHRMLVIGCPWFLSSLADEEPFASVWRSDWGGRWQWCCSRLCTGSGSRNSWICVLCWVSCLIFLILICQMEPRTRALCCPGRERWSAQRVWCCVWLIAGAQSNCGCRDYHVNKENNFCGYRRQAF